LPGQLHTADLQNGPPRGGLYRRHHRKTRIGRVTSRPVYAAIGVTLAGDKDVRGLWVGQGGEGAKFWMSALTDLKNRGIRKVFFVVCDGAEEPPEVVGSAWPQAIVQTGALHHADPPIKPVAVTHAVLSGLEEQAGIRLRHGPP